MQFVRKAEEAITGKKNESHESTKSSNHGPHSSNLANKLDPRVDSDRDNRAAHTDVTGAGLGTTHDTTHGTTATGTHGSTLGSGTTHGTSGVTGTGAGLGSSHPTTATGTHGSGTTYDTSDVTGTGAGLGSTHNTTGSTNAGPHSSNIANKADPRVDSDRDNRARHEGLTGTGLGSTHPTTATGTHGSALGSGTTHGTSGVTGTGAGLGSTHPTTASGTHGSALGSGTTHSTGAGLGSTHPTTATGTHGSALGTDTIHGTGLTGTGAGLGSTHPSTATGTHGSTLGSGTGATHSGPIPTPGTSSTNAGPHSSNIANKLDPRVDSDRDSYPQHQSPLAGTGPGTVTHGSHTRDTTAPGGSVIGGSGLGTTGHQDAVAGSSYNTSSTGTTTGTTGPHSSSIANKLDPRVDSSATRIENEDHRRI
ncbi:hypothetical protein DTO002I6_8342 [Penicillium roqueforti]|nr:hypothetical protein DTO002I6_8342 [Penicillium roqueforti]